MFKITPLELTLLIMADRNYSIKKAAKLLNTDEGSVKELAKRLEREGLLRVKKRRRIFGVEEYLEITDKGLDLLEDVAETLENVVENLRGLLEKGNIDGARAMLIKYTEYLPFASALGIIPYEMVRNIYSKLGVAPTQTPPEEILKWEGEEWGE